MTNLSVDTLVRRGSGYAEEAAERIDHAAERLSETLGSMLQALERTLERTLDRTPEKAKAALAELEVRSRQGHGYLREKPLAAMGAALAVGIVAALLLRRPKTVAVVAAGEDTGPTAKTAAKRPRAGTVKRKPVARTRRAARTASTTA